MGKYRKKPVVIEARQYIEGGINTEELLRWCAGDITSKGIMICTLEGDHLAQHGDFIIEGVKGEFYPCKPDIFKITYEKVEDGKEGENDAEKEQD